MMARWDAVSITYLLWVGKECELCFVTISIVRLSERKSNLQASNFDVQESHVRRKRLRIITDTSNEIQSEILNFTFFRESV